MWHLRSRAWRWNRTVGWILAVCVFVVATPLRPSETPAETAPGSTGPSARGSEQTWVARAAARPGGGQTYRAPSRSSSPSTPSRSYSSGSSSRSTYSPSTTRSSSGRSTTDVYVPTYSGTSDGSVTVSGSGGCNGFGLMVLMCIVVALLYLYIRSRGGSAARAEITVDAAKQQQGIQRLRSQDPGFDPQAFVERTKAVVRKVNDAWLAGNMGPARCLISDGIYTRFGTQLGLLKADGLRNCMADWKVVSADLLAAETDAMWDTVHVKIVGAARDQNLPLSLDAAGVSKKLSGVPISTYHEVWSFVRRRGKLSKQGVPALEGRCPSCGAELPLGEVVKCGYCQALVNSGEHDWVLAEITQPEEWRVGAAVDTIEGLEQLRQTAPSVSRQALEDRASVIFWKWIEARTTGKPDKLTRFCVVPPTEAERAAELQLATAKLRDVAVGSAELKEVHADPPMPVAIVEVRWSGSIDGGEPTFSVHELVLTCEEKALVSPKNRGGLSSLDCPVCAGQLAASDAAVCSYCQASLGGGKHEWSLLSVRDGVHPDELGTAADDRADDDDE